LEIMALRVFGSGWGRTGTMSLKLALERLGFGPCHHMVEIFRRPDTAQLWIDAANGRPDWEAVFAGYGSMTDLPGAAYWRELAAYYPDAKIIHTMRDPDAWFDSTQATILSPESAANAPNPVLGAFFETMTRDFQGGMHDRKHMIDLFNRHNEAVLAAIPKERLLVFEVRQGWEPLCDFLGVAVPDGPFPRENTTEQFNARPRDAHGAPDRAAIESELKRGGR
jgi:hypothetical protein